MPVLGSLQAGMMTDPCREGGGEGARKPGTRGWRHADRRRGSTQDGDTGARRTETQEHAGRRHRSTQDGDTGARRTETQEHAGRRHRSTQDGNAGTRRTETREHAGRRRRGHADANGPQPAKLRQIRKPPYPTSSRNSARCVHYKQKARSQKRPGPVLTYGAATLRRQQAPRLRLPTHTTSNRCTHRQARHMQQAQRRQAPKRLPAPRRARA